MKMSAVRGFNYQGSWGATGFDLWAHFDVELMRAEVRRGKGYFPGWNTVRWWLDQSAFQRDQERFMRNFRTGLGIFAEHGVMVIPVLFNRWHEPCGDFGGVYLDQIVPEFGTGVNEPITADVIQRGDMTGDRDRVWALDRAPGSPHTVRAQQYEFLDALAGAHRDDARILAWDACNEPLSGQYLLEDGPVRRAELQWLAWLTGTLRALGVTQPITMGNVQTPNHFSLPLTNDLVDVISIHPYYQEGLSSPEAYREHIALAVEIAKTAGKPLLATECVWGSLDDEVRTNNIRVTMETLRDQGVGVIVHALNHSLVADLHKPEYGPVGNAGRLEFIEADGSLRAGHEAFNDYAPTS